MSETVQEVVTKVEVKTNPQNVKELRDNIKALKQQLDQVKLGTDEWAEAESNLTEQQRVLKQVMAGTTATMEQIRSSAKGVDDSYNSLVNRMADLTKEWRATNDEVKRKDLSKEIGKINKQLKDLDASRGVYSRNVGDYANQMAQGFQSTAGAAGAVINPVKNVTAGLTAMSSTPIVAILGLVINLIDRMIKSLKSSEDTMAAFKVALAPLNALGTAFTNWVQAAGEQLVKLVDKTVKAARAVGKFFGLITEEDEARMEQHTEIVKKENELDKERREAEKANAKSAAEAANLRAKAAEKDKYSAAERLAFINKAADEEKKIADRNVDIAKKEYEILKEKASLAQNSKEENDALAAAEIKVTEAETAHLNKMRELNAQRAEAVNQMKKEEAAAISLNNTLRDLIATMEVESDGLDEVQDAALNLGDKWMQKLKVQGESIDREAERQIKTNQILIEDEQLRADEEFRIRMEAQEKKLELMRQAEEHTTDPLAALQLQQQIADMELDIEVQKHNKIREEEERTKRDRIEAAQKAASMTATIASGTANLLSTIADNMEVTNEKEFKRQQKLQVASATINMLSGVASAVATAMTMGPILGPIMGAINSAIVITSGVAQINKIKAQTFNGSGGSSAASAPAVVSPPNVETSLPTVRNVTSASEEDLLNRMASPVRAYIVDSELQAKESERDRRDRETTF